MGSGSETIPCVTDIVAEGDTVLLGGTTFGVLETPGHTIGHVVFTVVHKGVQEAVFTGESSPSSSALAQSSSLHTIKCARIE